MADALWGQQGFSFLAPFLSLMQADYGGGLHQVDFVNATEAARQTINNWVAQETNNKIQNLIPEGALDPLTRLVLTNAIYFKGQWATPFNPNLTQNAAFTLGSGGQVQVPTMHATDSLPLYAERRLPGPGIALPGNRLVMDVLLPTAGSGLAGLDVSQLPADLNGWLQGLTSQKVDVSLPKFQMTTQFNLNQSLEALGMTDAFSSGGRLLGHHQHRPGYQCRHPQGVHRRRRGGNRGCGRHGGRRDGDCLSVGMPYNPPIVFNADHPFLFLIRDTQSGSVVFMGQVADPAANGNDSSAPPVPKAQTVITDPINPVVVDPPPTPSLELLPAPSAVQLMNSPAGLTNLNNSSPARAPQFQVSGLTMPPAGDIAQVLVFADGFQIGQATVVGTSMVVTANGATTLTDGIHSITAVEEVANPAAQGISIASPASNAETIQVGTVVPQITSASSIQARSGVTLNYQVTTNALASEQLTYMLVAAPVGMTISSSGKVSWTPPLGTTSVQRVDVRVTNQYGNASDAVISIQVAGPSPFFPAAARAGFP